MATNDIQKIENDTGQAQLPALAPVEVKTRAMYFGVGLLPTTILFDYMTQGQFGESLVLGAIAGTTLAYFEPEIRKTFGPGLKAARDLWDFLNRNNSGRARHRLMDKNWWLYGKTSTPYAEQDDLTELEKAEPQEALPGPQQQDTPVVQSSSIPAQFTLGSQQLTAIKEVNAKRYVYFGEMASNVVVIPIHNMYHVLDVASSGKGKSNRFRLAMMQVVDLAETYFINPFANDVKAVNDSRKIEVWKPIFDRLANKRPVKDGPDILRLMNALVREIETRNEQEKRGDFSWTTNPIFVFIDELPEVFARCSGSIELLDKIGRTGRQFGVFCWVASQTALVDDTGLSTASQGQFKTRIYGGGDKTSSDRVMKGSVSRKDEATLQVNGAGLTLMLADGFSNTEFVRAPLVTNEALFEYFGLPPFQIEEWLSPKNVSHQPVQRLTHLLEEIDLSPFTLDTTHAQNELETPGERVKGERGERVKGPNEEAILDALEALDNEQKPLTLNAIAKKAGLTWHQYDEIEAVASWSGYDLDRGKGRPKEG